MTPEQLAVEFPLPADSLPQDGIPRGRIEKHAFTASRVFPGTVRDYYLYVPAQYDPARKTCVMVVQDGFDHLRPERRWQMPTVLDNLIHRGDIPVCIGIFVDPGKIPLSAAGAGPRSNRSFEYDSLSDRYARFLLDEILPEVGRRHNLAQDAGSRLIVGGSSGAFCALNAAWTRPDAFQRVLSIVGSYTALRGGNTLAALVRLTEPKPLRVFLEGGNEDLVVFAGSWWTANLDMLAALEYSGYEVNHAWAEHAGHNDFHGTAILPDALRWIWRDYPKAIQAGAGSKQPVAQVLIPGEGWERIGSRYPGAGRLAANAQGEVYFASESDRRIFKLGADGRITTAVDQIEGISDLAVAPDGRLHACQPRLRRIAAFDGAGKMSGVLPEIDAAGLGFAANGNLYVADPVECQIWLITPGGDRSVVDRSLKAPAGVRLTHNQAQLVATDRHGRLAHLFAIQPDGTLAHGAGCIRLNLPDEATDAGVEEIAPHAAGWICLATSLGLQLADETGLVCAIIPSPDRIPFIGAVFGGPAFTDLYVTCGDKLYRRKLAAPQSLWC